MEMIEFTGGRRIRFRTRTRGVGRGYANCSTAIFDEAMFLPEVSMAAIFPVITASEDPQIWYTGSAVDQESMDDGVAFARVRERALSGDTDRLAYFEWSLDADGPDDVGEDVSADPEVWARANPAFGIRIREDTIREERSNIDNRSFAVERLGVGDWPSTDQHQTVVDLVTWKLLTDENSEILGPVCLAFDVSPARSKATICAAGKRGDELLHVEVADEREGTGWLVPRLVELCREHNIASVLCDNRGPAASMVHDLESQSIDVQAVTGNDYGRACGLFVDVVNEKRLRHLGTSQLRAAIQGAKVRELGDAFAWARKKSAVDITPLVSATLALWGAEALDPGPASWSFG